MPHSPSFVGYGCAVGIWEDEKGVLGQRGEGGPSVGPRYLCAVLCDCTVVTGGRKAPNQAVSALMLRLMSTRSLFLLNISKLTCTVRLGPVCMPPLWITPTPRTN